MAKIYANLVIKGLWQIENVPMIWRAEVEKIIAQGKHQ